MCEDMRGSIGVSDYPPVSPPERVEERRASDFPPGFFDDFPPNPRRNGFLHTLGFAWLRRECDHPAWNEMYGRTSAPPQSLSHSHALNALEKENDARMAALEREEAKDAAISDATHSRMQLPGRLVGKSSEAAIYAAMAEGDTEVVAVLKEYVRHLRGVRGGGYPPLSMLFVLDDERIYGPRIAALYKKVCGEDIARFAEVIMGRVCNDIDRMKLNTSIDRGVVL
jgi:hypothetical protein